MTEQRPQGSTFRNQWAAWPAWARESVVLTIAIFGGFQVSSGVLLLTIATDAVSVRVSLLRFMIATVVAGPIAIGVFRLARLLQTHIDPWRWWRVLIAAAAASILIPPSTSEFGVVPLLYGAAVFIPIGVVSFMPRRVVSATSSV